jgi:CRISPR/Cas system endoribonuclease Cas6 (RAMP superfamily)
MTHVNSRQKRQFFLQNTQADSGAFQPTVQWVLWIISPEIKRQNKGTAAWPLFSNVLHTIAFQPHEKRGFTITQKV